jgi:hypothetical protein
MQIFLTLLKSHLLVRVTREKKNIMYNKNINIYILLHILLLHLRK